MRRQRETIINPQPCAIEELRLSDRLTKTARSPPFYQYGPGNDRGFGFDSTEDMVILMITQVQQNSGQTNLGNRWNIFCCY